MSHDAMNWAFKQAKTLKPATLLVLVRLSDAYNDHIGYAEISYKYLLKDLPMAKNTIIKHIDLLIEGGFVSKCRQTRDNGAHAFNRYYLAVNAQDVVHPSAETEPPPSAETEQAPCSPSCTRVVQPVEQGKKPLREHSSPHSPPKGEDPVHQLIDDFEPADALVKDMARQGVGPEDFIRWAVKRWRNVAKAGGQRVTRPASNFQRWLSRHKDLKGLRGEWQRTVAPKATTATAPPPVTPDRVFDSAAGQAALRRGVGGAFLHACQQASTVLDDAAVDRLVDARAEAVVDPDDKAAAMVARATEGREKALAGKYLKEDDDQRGAA